MGNCLNSCVDDAIYEEDEEHRQRKSKNSRNRLSRQHDENEITEADLSDDERSGMLRRPRAFQLDPAMTRTELNKKRGEFWDTQPYYGGSRVVWDTLKAIIEHPTETDTDRETQWAIINGAGLKLPHKCLIEIYDELGAKYELPNYVIRDPSNIIEDGAPMLPTGVKPEMAPVPEAEADSNANANTGDSIEVSELESPPSANQ